MELSGVVGRNVSWYNHLDDSLILTGMAEDVHSVLGQVPWETDSEKGGLHAGALLERALRNTTCKGVG